MSTIWLDKLRGLFVQDSGTPLSNTGRIGTINFLGAVLSYNQATGVLDVSLGGNNTGFTTTTITYTGLSLSPTDVENSPSYMLPTFTGSFLITGYASYSIDDSSGTLTTRPRVNATLERSDNGSSWTNVATSEIIEGTGIDGTYGQIVLPPSSFTAATNRRVRVVLGAHANGGDEMLVIPSVVRLSILAGSPL